MMAMRASGAWRRCLPRLARAAPLAPRFPLAGPGAARGIVHAETVGTVVQVGKENHWATFMYGRERQLLVHVVKSAEEGDVQSVLAAMDEFWAHHFGMKGVDSWTIRKELLDGLVRDKTPTYALELGTYCGYSALRIARNLPENGFLVSIDVDPLFGAIATKIIEHAGLSHKVKVLTGTVETKLKRIASLIGPEGKADFVLCDHSKERFVPDLELLEGAGVAGPGTVVMGDTTVYPGEEAAAGGKDLLTYFAGSDHYRVAQHVGTEKASKSGITVCEWQHLV